MNTLALAFLACFVAALILLVQAWRHLTAERRTNATIRKAYAELTAGSTKRETELVSRVHVAEADADRLAPVVAQYLKDIDETAALLKDAHPPALLKEREALMVHNTLVNLRTTKQ